MANTTKAEMLDQWSKAQSDLLCAEKALNDTLSRYANCQATGEELAAAGARLVETRAHCDRVQQSVLSRKG